MGLRSALVVLAAGLVLALAVTVRTSYVDLPLLGWSLVIAAVAGLVIAGLAEARRAPQRSWYGSGPWLLAAGAAGWLAVRWPPTPGIDLVTVGFILFMLGAGVTLAALYSVSSFRLGGALRGYWQAPPRRLDEPTDPYGGAARPYVPPAGAYSPPAAAYPPPMRPYPPPASPTVERPAGRPGERLPDPAEAPTQQLPRWPGGG